MRNRLSHIMTAQIPADIQLFAAYRFPTSHTASTHAPAAPACCHNTAAIVVLDVPRERPGKSKKPRANVRSLVGGDRGIRTLEPLNTTNTLAGCPYRPLRHVSMLHIGATTWHLTIVPRTSATRCAARGVIRGLTTGQRAGFESPVNVTITATISSATPAISRRPALRQARPRAGGKEIATAAPQPVRQGPLHPGPARYDKGYEYRT